MTLDTYDIRLSQILCSWRAHSMQIMDHPRCQCLGQAQWTTHHQCTSSNALTFTLSEHNLARVVWVRELRVSRGTVSAYHNPVTDADLLLAHPTCDLTAIESNNCRLTCTTECWCFTCSECKKAFFVCLFAWVCCVCIRAFALWMKPSC